MLCNVNCVVKLLLVIKYPVHMSGLSYYVLSRTCYVYVCELCGIFINIMYVCGLCIEKFLHIHVNARTTKATVVYMTTG
jgi:hypothetical protein